jgi:squalene synthase HpnC
VVIDPRTPVVQLLNRFGPGPEGFRPPPIGREEAWEYVRGLTTTHYENFSVLSALVPVRLRDDFAAVYAFCRWSDDLGDETGSTPEARARSTELLSRWRSMVGAIFDDAQPEHPVLIALQETVRRHALPERPFADLISAFEQDQTVTTYESWDQVLDYCTRSANPVGRLVLMLGGFRPRGEDGSGDDREGRFSLSDDICTALQLTNFWQDVRRDLLDRGRVYMPVKETGLTPGILRDWASRPEDPQARVPFISALRGLVRKTWPLFERGRALPALLGRELGPVVGLFLSGGCRVLRSVERSGCTTLWHRPRLSRLTKAMLVGRALLGSRLGLPPPSPVGSSDPEPPTAARSPAASDDQELSRQGVAA